MKRTLSHLAIMALLFSSLAFAGDKDKSTSTSTDARPAFAGSSDSTAQSINNPCVSAGDKKEKNKDKNKAKPAPSDQEEQFNKVLMGIYG